MDCIKTIYLSSFVNDDKLTTRLFEEQRAYLEEESGEGSLNTQKNDSVTSNIEKNVILSTTKAINQLKMNTFSRKTDKIE